jgi:enoyl-CoA hydratase/carnithine racemase
MNHIALSIDADAIATITLDRPPANALNSEIATELETALDAILERDDVRCLVIRSANPRFFMAGGDIGVYAEKSAAELAVLVAHYRQLFRRVHELPVPTVAVADGHAVGGGAELFMACDFRVVGPRAKVGTVEILIGGLPSAGGTWLLPRLVGYSRALELMISGRSLDQDEALRVGLATSAAEDALGEGMRIAREIASRSPVAVRWIKRCALAAVGGDLSVVAALEDEATTAIGATEEFRAEVASFLARSGDDGRAAR